MAASPSDEDRLRQAVSLAQRDHLAQAMDVIGHLDIPATITPTVGRLAFLRATLAQRLQHDDAARDAYNLVWLAYPPLADYAAWELAQTAAARDDLPVLEAIVNTLARQYPTSLRLPDSQLLLAQTQHRLGQVDAAAATVNHFLQSYPFHHAVPHALFLQAQLAEAANDPAAAAHRFRHLGESYPHHDLASLAFRRSRQLMPQLPASQQRSEVQPDLAILNRLIEAQHWPEVEQRLEQLTQAAPASIPASRILLMQAIVAQQRRQPREAIALLQQWLLHHPNSAERAEAHYRLAQLYHRQDQHTESDTHFRHALAQPHDAVWTPKALLRFARILEDRNELDEASRLYHQVAERFPEHDDAIFSFWQTAWLQYRLGRYNLAASIWRLFIERFPHHAWRPQVLYWLGRVAQHRDYPSNALALYQRVAMDYPFHYYSLRAREQLQQLSVPPPPITVPNGDTNWPWEDGPLVLLPSSATRQITPEQFHLIRVQEFQHLQMRRKAQAEIDALAALLPRSPASDYFLAKLFAQTDHHLAAFRRLNQIISTLTPMQIRDLPREFWTLLYPKTFWDHITPQATRHGLSPYLVLSLIRQESAFNPRALSHAGARGLMQLIPSTARIVARQTWGRRFNLHMLFEPQANIQLGTHYFSHQLQQFDHNPVFALAAYNAGPHRVEEWRQRWPDLPMDEFIEQIPFTETRLYVKLTLRNLLIYEYLYHPVPDA
ncbi:MAG TPA: transglycosylase SLT domain-containing protein [Candidatus Entotheonella sp.]